MPEEKEIETVYRCSECDSADVEQLAWCHLNQEDTIDWSYGQFNDSDDNFCNDCQKGVKIKIIQP